MPCFKERKCKDTTFLGEIQINSWFFVVLSLIYRIFADKIINKSIMAENEQNKQGLQLELPQEVAQGEYTNWSVEHSFPIINYRWIEHLARFLKINGLSVGIG